MSHFKDTICWLQCQNHRTIISQHIEVDDYGFPHVITCLTGQNHTEKIVPINEQLSLAQTTANNKRFCSLTSYPEPHL